jgi:biotin carboxylase
LIVTTHRAEDLPLLAVAHGPRSLPTFQLVEALAGICRVLWLIDRSEPETSQLPRLLSRFGPVVDMDGLRVGEAAGLVGEHGPDGIVAYRDNDISRVSLVAAELGLRFHEPDVARRLVDKLHQRRALAAAGLPTPRVVDVVVAGNASVADEVASQLSFPVMLKPRRGNGSAQVFKAASPQELAALLARCASSRPQDDNEFIVEEFLEDDAEMALAGYASFVSVESVVVDGAVHHLATNGRLPLAEPFRETGTFIPSQLDPAHAEAVLEVAGLAIRALGVRHGCLHTEIKLTPQGPRVIEVNGRIGGGVPDMLRLASGGNILALSMRLALGQLPDIEDMIACRRIGYRLMYQPPADARVMSSISGLDLIPQLPDLHSFSVKHGPGDEFDAADGSAAYLFEVIGSVADHEALLELSRRVHDGVSVTYGKRAS